MAPATSVYGNSPFKPRAAQQTGKTQQATEDLAELIEDMIRMIENTRSFLKRLDGSRSDSQEATAISCQRLEEALASLKRRKQSLIDCEYSGGN